MSAWSRFWNKWNTCRACSRGRAVLGTVLSLIGSMLMSFAIMYAIQAAAANAAAAPAYEGSACADCPAGVSFETVQVQDREGSVLFAIGGTIPDSVGALPADVRLEANDIDVVLRPDADGFRILSATRGGAKLPPEALAAGITDGHLVIDLRDDALRAPVTFTVGLWQDGAYMGRLPRQGTLEWAGSGAPRAMAAATAAPSAAAATPAPTAAVTAAPTRAAATPSGPDATTLAAACTSFATRLPPFPRPMSVTSGSGADPRTGVTTDFISTTFAARTPTDPAARGAFSVTVALARAGQATGGGERAIDRIGSVQLWAYWDGAAMHKAVRTWTGSAWQARTNAAADDLTVALRAQSLAVYWTGLRSGDQYGAIVAASAGCGATGADDQGRPQRRIP